MDTVRSMSAPAIDFVHPALDLVNSQHGKGPDLLDHDLWFTGFLAQWGYAAAGQPSERQRTRLVALRAVMRRMIETLDEGDPPTSADLAELNVTLGSPRLRRELTTTATAFEVRLVPARQDWVWVLSELAASFGQLLADGQIDRIKLCDNHECRFAFYDLSKNRNRRWCANTTCGNRHKVRQFRARQRALARSTDH
jgi:predicted RNA-binding Zn ribbon-like protein